MKAYAPQTEQKTQRAPGDVARGLVRNPSSAGAQSTGGTVIVNRRPEAAGLGQLRAMANRSPQVQRLEQFQARAEMSSRVRDIALWQARADVSPRVVSHRPELQHRAGNAAPRESGPEEKARSGLGMGRAADRDGGATVVRMPVVSPSAVTQLPPEASGLAVVQAKWPDDGKAAPTYRRRGRKLGPKAAANRERLYARRRAEAERRERVNAAEREFHAITDAHGFEVNPWAFPFDPKVGPRDAQKNDEDNRNDVAAAEPWGNDRLPVDHVLDRLPAALGRSQDLHRLLSQDDSGRGDRADEGGVTKLALQESLAGLQFADERGLPRSSVNRSDATDFIVRTADGGPNVAFDPFMSPARRPPQPPKDKATPQDYAKKGLSALKKEEKGFPGTYRQHTHDKGGVKGAVGVWDKTYTPADQESRLRGLVGDAEADEGATVHELRVPLARMYAQEHVHVEDQLKARQQKMQEISALEQRYKKAQRGKPKQLRLDLQRALMETGPDGRPTQRAEYWLREYNKL